ncbi:MAG TPA: BatA domain-containing protein [Tepidisphaeraceae bacterium]|nr:BatA domain-containing protein [Tepidisphaeraceae bacterium]
MSHLHILAAPFVTPAFAVAGLALAAIPIVIHLLNRRRFKTVQWAAMDFLLRAMKKNRRRLKFEQWLLLATRCALFALLGLALARPTGCENTTLSKIAAQRAGVHVIVIDNSGSTAYESGRSGASTNLARAKQLAKEQIDRLASGTEAVAIVTAAQPATLALKSTFDLEAARGTIDRIEQTYAATDLAGALQLVMEVGRSEARQPERSLHLFTDSARTAWEGNAAEAIQRIGPDAAKVFAVAHYNVAIPNQSNAAAVELRPTSNLVSTQFPIDFLATLREFGPSRTVQTQWKLDDAVLPGGSTMSLDPATPPVTQSQARFGSGGPHVLSVSVIGGDKLRVDDTRYRVVDVRSQLKTLIVEGEHGVGLLGSSGTFLSLALSPPRPQGEQGSSYVATEVIGELEFGNKVLEDYSAVILAGVGQITSQASESLAKYVSGGGSLIIFMGEAVSAETYNGTLLPRRLMPGALVKRMSASGDQPAFTFDFRPRGVVHPMLSAFANQENSGLDTAQVFTYWQAAIPADSGVERVLDYLPPEGAPGDAARDPGITVHSLGAGRVVFFSTSANSEWTTLPAKPAYVAMMHELISGSVSSGDEWRNRIVGQPLVLPANLRLTAAPTLTDSTGTPIAFVPGAPSPTTAPLPRPGIYSLNTGNTVMPVAVNMPAEESDMRTVDGGVIKTALGDQNVSIYDDALAPLSTAAATGNDFGWTVMFIVLALIGFESFMAMRFGHQRRMVGQ